MSGINTVLEEMTPAVEALVSYLNQSRQLEALAFFTQVQARLDKVHDEEQLLDLFVLLSMTAFQGFSMDVFAAMMADQVLAYAEQVAHTYSSDDETVH